MNHALIPVGARVVARDAYNQLRSGTVDRVPSWWRDQSHNVSFTVRGEFPKMWIRFVDSGSVVPWPAEDVFVDIERANAAVEAKG